MGPDESDVNSKELSLNVSKSIFKERNKLLCKNIQIDWPKLFAFWGFFQKVLSVQLNYNKWNVKYINLHLFLI